MRLKFKIIDLPLSKPQKNSLARTLGNRSIHKEHYSKTVIIALTNHMFSAVTINWNRRKSIGVFIATIVNYAHTQTPKEKIDNYFKKGGRR